MKKILAILLIAMIATSCQKTQIAPVNTPCQAKELDGSSCSQMAEIVVDKLPTCRRHHAQKYAYSY